MTNFYILRVRLFWSFYTKFCHYDGYNVILKLNYGIIYFCYKMSVLVDLLNSGMICFGFPSLLGVTIGFYGSGYLFLYVLTYFGYIIWCLLFNLSLQFILFVLLWVEFLRLECLWILKIEVYCPFCCFVPLSNQMIIWEAALMLRTMTKQVKLVLKDTLLSLSLDTFDRFAISSKMILWWVLSFSCKWT